MSDNNETNKSASQSVNKSAKIDLPPLAELPETLPEAPDPVPHPEMTDEMVTAISAQTMELYNHPEELVANPEFYSRIIPGLMLNLMSMSHVVLETRAALRDAVQVKHLFE